MKRIDLRQHDFPHAMYELLALEGIAECSKDFRVRPVLQFLCSMFDVTWTTFKFSRDQLGTISAYVMISVPWSNQRAH